MKRDRSFLTESSENEEPKYRGSYKYLMGTWREREKEVEKQKDLESWKKKICKNKLLNLNR